MNIITKVEEDSIALEMGVCEKDVLISVNDQKINDIFDYRYLIKNEELEVLIEKPNGEKWVLEIEKDEDEDLGLHFENPLMAHEKTCKNKCIFCFIDQNPKGMRKSIYFKDDDSRLSFLDGNFVTLTNMKDEELDRIIFYHLSPINISVHSTDPALRTMMLKNPRSALIMDQIERITSARIETNFQIVLCKGINDKSHLDKSIEDLARFFPFGKSLTIVPLGMSKHREGLPQLERFSSEDAKEVIEQVSVWQKKFKKELGSSFAFLADEFYLLAGVSLPDYDHYEGYSQIENGIGMIRSFEEEFYDEIKNNQDFKSREISIVTGTCAYDFIKGLCTEIEKRYPVKINVHRIVNDFYGSTITVSGLLTGRDIIRNLKSKDLGDAVYIPMSSLRNHEDIFLDDITVSDIEKELNIDIVPLEIHGGKFLKNILGQKIENNKRKTYSA